jgi:hypothetical protein
VGVGAAFGTSATPTPKEGPIKKYKIDINSMAFIIKRGGVGVEIVSREMLDHTISI